MFFQNKFLIILMSLFISFCVFGEESSDEENSRSFSIPRFLEDLGIITNRNELEEEDWISCTQGEYHTWDLFNWFDPSPRCYELNISDVIRIDYNLENNTILFYSNSYYVSNRSIVENIECHKDNLHEGRICAELIE